MNEHDEETKHHPLYSTTMEVLINNASHCRKYGQFRNQLINRGIIEESCILVKTEGYKGLREFYKAVKNKVLTDGLIIDPIKDFYSDGDDFDYLDDCQSEDDDE